MKTIALRFSDKFAPEEGTISAHENYIEEKGYVWYGKLGNPISKKISEEILKDRNETPILLIHSGKTKRYWAYVNKIQRDQPGYEDIPAYYRDDADKFKTWFRVTKIVEAEKEVMGKCIVSSSKQVLSNVSKHSMSPYFIIEYEDKE